MPNTTVILNIGLNTEAVRGKGAADLPAHAAVGVVAAHQVSILHEWVGPHPATGEPTLVLALEDALTTEEYGALCDWLHQEAIAVLTAEGGKLYGPKAQAWGPFDGSLFLSLNGKPLIGSETN